MADVHQNIDKTAEPMQDFSNAIDWFNYKDGDPVDFICICGDIMQNYNNDSELDEYSNLISLSKKKIYTCTGNHDCPRVGEFDVIRWRQKTGCEKNFSFEYNGDVFIFFSMSNYNLGSSGHPYDDQDIVWLESILESNKMKRCFVFTHLFFPDKAGNFKAIYPKENWLGGEQLIKLNDLNKKYLNAIWFSGHSHWKWYLQKYEDKANVFRTYDDLGNPTCGWTVHVPSCASPIDSDGSSRTVMNGESEGAIVDVYEDHVDIRGIVFKNEIDPEYTNKYLPIATYRLDNQKRIPSNTIEVEI